MVAHFRVHCIPILIHIMNTRGVVCTCTCGGCFQFIQQIYSIYLFPHSLWCLQVPWFDSGGCPPLHQCSVWNLLPPSSWLHGTWSSYSLGLRMQYFLFKKWMRSDTCVDYSFIPFVTSEHLSSDCPVVVLSTMISQHNIFCTAKPVCEHTTDQTTLFTYLLPLHPPTRLAPLQHSLIPLFTKTSLRQPTSHHLMACTCQLEPSGEGRTSRRWQTGEHLRSVLVPKIFLTGPTSV